MDRRRVVIVAAAVALVGGVVVMRTAGSDDAPKQPKQPPPTSVTAYAADGVLIPSPHDRPRTPSNVVTRSGHHRLKITWDGDAPGYEVRWGERVRYVTPPAIQLDGLDNDREVKIDIRAVDAFGQRSQPVSTAGTPHADNASYEFVDRFDGDHTPDPARWRFAKRTDCARATPGDGDDHDRLIITSSCATNVVSLRSRTPFVRAEESRFVVETDAAGGGGELLLDLVPGPVSIQSDAVPPESIRLKVTTDASGNSLVELFPNGSSQSLPHAVPGISVRWELVLTPGGVRAERDGVPVATSPYVPSWQSATALVGLAALAGDSTRVGVDLIGFRGGKTDTPTLVPSPPIDVQVTSSAPPAPPKPAVVGGGQLRIALVPAEAQDPQMKLLIGGAELTLKPAVPGTPWQPGVEYQAIADLDSVPTPLNAALRSATRVQVTHVDIELFPEPGARPPSPGPTVTDPLRSRDKMLARPRVDLLDASGQPMGEGAAVPRGRLVLEVRLDSLSGSVSGLAGFDVRLDDSRIATVSTTADGPGVAGRWRISLNTATLSQSPHTIELRAFSTDPGVATESTYVSFLLKR
ncbi:hypothetical protein Lesp02_46760 [Lentzea sp. NBRC 105346]|uniref:hypothetical protein n=1 Tax=Lentzea sp. NBRC 105346 TaxID=3032205 RepID=UPI0024A54274|nr:hypothetical protein [Lentzea sp. NBRC 105346]GLZ32488.1 hypothetical protein Lesp02_46760 [Lentzea sp. NBRC 105346]